MQRIDSLGRNGADDIVRGWSKEKEGNMNVRAQQPQNLAAIRKDKYPGNTYETKREKKIHST